MSDVSHHLFRFTAPAKVTSFFGIPIKIKFDISYSIYSIKGLTKVYKKVIVFILCSHPFSKVGYKGQNAAECTTSTVVHDLDPLPPLRVTSIHFRPRAPT